MTDDGRRKFTKILSLIFLFASLPSSSSFAVDYTNELFDPNQAQDIEAMRAQFEQQLKEAGEKAAAATAQPNANPNLPHVGESAAIAFTSMDGKEVDVSKMAGKVVLVDYWATWCAPCMKGLTRLTIIYNKYHGRGFDIVGVSLDEDRAALEAVIGRRNLAWPQAFDGKGWETPLAAQYDIKSIPASILIGKDGKVVALNLRDDALDMKVSELLSE